MSSYTTVILTCLDYDDNMKTVPTLNGILSRSELPIFERATQGDGVFILIGNYLPLLDIIDVVNAIPWYNADAVQLWHRDEHHNKFTEVELNLARIVVRHVMEFTPGEDGKHISLDERGSWSMKRLENIVAPG